MNILLTTHLYPTPGREDLSGDANALHEFARRWVEDGHQVTVLHAYMHKYLGAARLKLLLPRFRFERTQLDGVQILRVEMRFIKAISFIRRIFMRAAGRRAGRMIVGTPDIMLCHFPVITAGLSEATGFPCPRAGILHTTDISAAKKQGLRDMPGGYAALGFRSRRIECDFDAQITWKGPRFTVYSGAPVSELPKRSEVTHAELRIIYVGKLIARKQADLLIRALSRVNGDFSYRLTIVGDGSQRVRYEALAKELGIEERVFFTGEIPRDQVLALMAQQDVFAMLSFGETFGLVYLEAMAQGLITVGSRGEGIDGIIIDRENGFLLDAADEEGFADLMLQIARLPEQERQRLRENARTTACAMDETSMARKYLCDAVNRTGGKL